MRKHVLELASHSIYEGFAENTNEVSDTERFNRLQLLRSENVGPINFHQLLKKFGNAANALDALPELSRLGGRKTAIKPCPVSEIEAEMLTANKLGISLVCHDEQNYPPLLKNLDIPPPMLYLQGDIALINRPIVSIVGARNCSSAGHQITKIIATALGKLGYVIASGLARGIDTTAHEATLQSGTIAIVAGGINIYYPPENKELQHAISSKGLLIAENPPGFLPRGQDFPRRNRIISGISHAVLVIEAALKSGSLITARYALEQNREVFAMPGNPLDIRAAGTNKLIKSGAHMLTCADDVTEVLTPMLRSLPLYFSSNETNTKTQTPLHSKQLTSKDAERQKLLLALGPTPTDVDELIRCTGLTPAHIQTILLELDLAGRLERHGQQKVSLKTDPNNQQTQKLL